MILPVQRHNGTSNGKPRTKPRFNAKNPIRWPPIVNKARASPIAKSLLHVMIEYAHNETWELFPHHDTLALDSGRDIGTVRKAIRELTDSGFLEVVRKATSRTPNIYRIRWDLLAKSAEAAWETEYAIARG